MATPTLTFKRCSSSLTRHATNVTQKSLRKSTPLNQFIAATNNSRSYFTTRPTLYSFDPSSSGGDELHNWPISKTNTILNIVPQGKRFVVERFGKLEVIQPSGFFFAIPLVDRIAYIVDTRERAIDVAPQSAITRDNVSVEVSGNLFVQFVDPEKAAYGARNPLYSVVQVSSPSLTLLKW